MKKGGKKSKVFLPIILVVFLLAVCAAVGYFLFANKDDIKLNGNEVIKISLGMEYIDEGVTGNKDVNVIGKVDNTKVGKYEITYKTKKTTLKRTVEVVDDIKPEISLKGSNEIYLYKGTEYVDSDFVIVKDNYDEDVSNNIKVENGVDINNVGDYKIKYTVSDSSGNTSSVERLIHVIDEDVAMNRIPILMYHFFYDESAGETPRDNNFIEVKKFEEQIKYLVDNNYYFPTWNEIEMFLDKKIKLPEKSIVITVDDGDPSFFKYGTKVLEKYKVPATSFFITSWYFKDLYEYDPNLITIQSHTNNMHTGGCNGKGKFLCIDRQEGINDLKQSISMVDSDMVFCYPFGHNSDYTKSIVKEVGFHMALTTEEGKIIPGMDKFVLPRVRVSGTESMNYFIKSIS